MSIHVRCNTGADEIRSALDDDAEELVLEFEFPDVGELQVIPAFVLGTRGELRGRFEVLCMLGNSYVVTLVLPAEADGTDDVRLEGSDRVVAYVNDCAAERAREVEVLALEEYLRWQEQLMLWGAPEAADDGPYARHPRLFAVPLDKRTQIADLVAAGRPDTAAWVLRYSVPEFDDPDDAEDVVNALTFYS